MTNDISLKYIRQNHVTAIEDVSTTLNGHGYEVSLAGSARYRADYSDIDLIATPSKPSAAYPNSLNQVLQRLGESSEVRIVDRSLDTRVAYVGGISEARYRFEYRDAMFDMNYRPR